MLLVERPSLRLDVVTHALPLNVERRSMLRLLVRRDATVDRGARHVVTSFRAARFVVAFAFSAARLARHAFWYAASHSRQMRSNPSFDDLSRQNASCFLRFLHSAHAFVFADLLGIWVLSVVAIYDNT